MSDTATSEVEVLIPPDRFDSFGARLWLLRTHLGWNKKYLAEVTGISAHNLGQWENGANPRDVVASAKMVAAATDSDYLWLVAGVLPEGFRTGSR